MYLQQTELHSGLVFIVPNCIQNVNYPDTFDQVRKKKGNKTAILYGSF